VVWEWQADLIGKVASHSPLSRGLSCWSPTAKGGVVRVSLQEVVIIGAGRFGRHALSIFEAVNLIQPTFDVVGFIVDPQYGAPGTYVNDKPILGSFDWLAEHKDVQVLCAVGPPELRLRLVRRAEQMGVQFCSIVHPSAILTRWTTMGKGVAIAESCTLGTQIQIGNNVQMNMGCNIGHDALVEDFVTLAAGVNIAGNVTLREGCYIGIGANIIERKEIGAWSIVGAGSTILENVPYNSTVVGVPGKVIKTRPDGWHLE
jgi:sugar O-acyltransferase (sialic acid O-acetyltransferase NeuD family)